MKYGLVILTSAVALGACAEMAPRSDAPAGASAELACSIATNCVNSLGTGGLRPLQYAAAPEQAMATLRATLATFPEATVVRNAPMALEVIFTTPAGFRDQVDFRVDPLARRIDFRSRSLFGLFDWGKNRSRMEEFASRFNQRARQ